MILEDLQRQERLMIAIWTSLDRQASHSARLRLAALLLAWCIGLGWSTPAPAKSPIDVAQRHALVVANADYLTAPLANALNDARAMAGMLQELGFVVRLVENISASELEDHLDSIMESFAPGGIGLFYYAGHALQHGGVNYLLPIDFAVEEPEQLSHASLDLGQILDAMDRRGVGLRLIILDACRDYPLGSSDEAFGSGLASMDAGGETLIAYATSAGKVALDGSGPNSPYTAALLTALETPGLDIYDILRLVRGNVRTATNGFQIPWVTGSIETKVVLRTELPAQLEEALGEEITPDAIHWTAIARSRNPADFEDFLAAHPGSRFGDQARARLERLEAEGVPPAPLPTVEEFSLYEEDPSAQVTACDVWAARPNDQQRVAEGVPAPLRNLRQGLIACAKALAADGDIARYAYQLGASLSQMGRFQEAKVFFERAAQASYAAALKDLGYMYRHGRGVERDFVRAGNYFISAALLGDPSAKLALGAMYRDGVGVERSPQLSLEWLKMSANDGYAPAMVALGTAFRDGSIVERDDTDALFWYRRASALGDSNATTNLAQIYIKGDSVERNLPEGLALLSQALEEGNARAPYHLGLLHRSGEHVERDPARALELFELSAERGYNWAFYQLARMYSSGELGNQDLLRAYQYFVIAGAIADMRSGGDLLSEEAEARRLELAELIDDETARKALTAAETWLKANGGFRFSFHHGMLPPTAEPQ